MKNVRRDRDRLDEDLVFGRVQTYRSHFVCCYGHGGVEGGRSSVRRIFVAARGMSLIAFKFIFILPITCDIESVKETGTGRGQRA